MSTPMYDLPEHVMIGVNVDGNGPVPEDDPAWVENVCWCGRPGCTLYRLETL